MQRAMRNVTYYTFGHPDLVLLLRCPVSSPPPPAENEIRVKVDSTSINPVDIKRMYGSLGWIATRLPYTPCLDVSGTVEVVGPNCKGFQPGDQVVGQADPQKGGGLAEFVNLNSKSVIKKPKNMSFEAAAGLPTAGVASMQGLVDKAKVKKGDKVLIIGGSGGTGTFAIQIAKALGAHVVTTTSPPKAKVLQRLGADEIVDHTDPDWTDSLKGRNFDVVFDCHGGYWHESKKNLLKRRGHYVTLAPDNPDTKLTIPSLISFGCKVMWRKAASLTFLRPKYTFFISKVNREDLQRLAEFVEKGKVRTVVGKVFPFERFKEAFAIAENGPLGKIIIKVDVGPYPKCTVHHEEIVGGMLFPKPLPEDRVYSRGKLDSTQPPPPKPEKITVPKPRGKPPKPKVGTLEYEEDEDEEKKNKSKRRR